MTPRGSKTQVATEAASEEGLEEKAVGEARSVSIITFK